MDQERLRAKLLTVFLGELEERLGALDHDLLGLEQDPGSRAERLHALFRTAHSLKGAASSAAAPQIAAISHRLEEWFAAARDGRSVIDGDFLQLCFGAADEIREAGRRLTPAGTAASAMPSRAPQAATTEDAPPLAAATLRPERMAAGAVARITADKLDALLAKSGELLIARGRVRARSGQAAALAEFVQRSRAEWPSLLKAAGAGRSAELRRGRAGDVLAHITDKLERLDREVRQLAAGIAEDAVLLEHSAGPLDEEVRRIRMLPFGEACSGLDRTVRDLARAGGKTARLVIEGAHTEIDRSVLDGLRDALLHLVRNAVDHGIEEPAARRAAGKPPVGRITVSAALRGNAIEVVVADDGGGFDFTRIRAEAHRRHLPSMDDDALTRAIFLPGFTTAGEVTEISGRGVGLDVVLSTVQAMRGAVVPFSRQGEGTRFVVTLPLTLTTLRAILVALGEQRFAIDIAAVVRLHAVAAGALRDMAGRPAIDHEGRPVPLARLSELLGLAASVPAARSSLAIMIVRFGADLLAIEVDELLSEQEIVVRSLGRRLERLRHAAGAAILPDGGIVLILSAAELVRTGLGAGVWAAAPPAAASAAPRRKRLLLADDSMTTRMLVRNILETAGYDVAAAVDGAQAWKMLEEQGADLVVSDVDMPRMDGFELTEAIRRSGRFRELPVVLLTARENDEDRLRGMQAGASAYLVKSAFDQRNLIETIGQHV